MKQIFLGLAVLLLNSTASAAIITSFSDNFEADAPTQLNSSLTNWNVLNGTIDVVVQPAYGLSCVGGSGACIDLDGSTSNAGDIKTKDSFDIGSYILNFSLSGNQRGGLSDTVEVSFGDLFETITLNPFDGWNSYSFVANLDSVEQLTFSHKGGDNIGIMLDNVSVSAAVPEPSILALMGLGLVGLGFSRRRKSQG